MIHLNIFTTLCWTIYTLQEAVYGALVFPILRELWFKKQWEEIPVVQVTEILNGEGYKMSSSEKMDYEMSEIKGMMSRILKMQQLEMQDRTSRKPSNMLKRMRGFH